MRIISGVLVCAVLPAYVVWVRARMRLWDREKTGRWLGEQFAQGNHCIHMPFARLALEPQELILIAERYGYRYCGSGKMPKVGPVAHFTRSVEPAGPAGSGRRYSSAEIWQRHLSPASVQRHRRTRNLPPL